MVAGNSGGQRAPVVSWQLLLTGVGGVKVLMLFCVFPNKMSDDLQRNHLRRYAKNIDVVDRCLHSQRKMKTLAVVFLPPGRCITGS